jgi:uncharacterized membrane protein
MVSVPFSEDTLFSLLATVTMRLVHGYRFSKSCADDFFTSNSVHPESAVISVLDWTVVAQCAIALIEEGGGVDF